eukprot:429342_1
MYHIIGVRYASRKRRVVKLPPVLCSISPFRIIEGSYSYVTPLQLSTEALSNELNGLNAATTFHIRKSIPPSDSKSFSQFPSYKKSICTECRYQYGGYEQYPT